MKPKLISAITVILVILAFVLGFVGGQLATQYGWKQFSSLQVVFVAMIPLEVISLNGVALPIHPSWNCAYHRIPPFSCHRRIACSPVCQIDYLQGSIRLSDSYLFQQTHDSVHFTAFSKSPQRYSEPVQKTTSSRSSSATHSSASRTKQMLIPITRHPNPHFCGSF